MWLHWLIPLNLPRQILLGNKLDTEGEFQHFSKIEDQKQGPEDTGDYAKKLTYHVKNKAKGRYLVIRKDNPATGPQQNYDYKKDTLQLAEVLAYTYICKYSETLMKRNIEEL